MTEPYDNTNRGALFKNNKGENPKRPDYTGELNVDGVDFRLSGWVRESKQGRKFVSLSVELKREKNAAQTVPAKAAEQAEEEGDDIPF